MLPSVNTGGRNVVVGHAQQRSTHAVTYPLLSLVHQQELARTDDLIRFWRSEFKVIAGCQDGEVIHITTSTLRRWSPSSSKGVCCRPLVPCWRSWTLRCSLFSSFLFYSVLISFEYKAVCLSDAAADILCRCRWFRSSLKVSTTLTCGKVTSLSRCTSMDSRSPPGFNRHVWYRLSHQSCVLRWQSTKTGNCQYLPLFRRCRLSYVCMSC